MPITSRTFPTFRLTHTTAITVTRKARGNYDDQGMWQDGSETTVNIEANVQPVPPREILIMPESDRTKEWIKVYSTSELRTANESVSGWDADEILWDGNTYKVMKSQHWKMGVLDHYKVLAARVPVSARGV